MLKLNEIDIEEINFPDGQVHYKIIPFSPFYKDKDIEYTISIKTPKDLYKLQVISELCNQRGYKLKHLIIPYLMGGRYDRAMYDGDINPLKLIINTINSLSIDEITLFEPHSDVTTALFNGIVNVKYFDFEGVISSYYNKHRNVMSEDEIAIVFPDAGAYKRYSKQITGNYTFLTANKVRDLKTGNLQLEVSNTESVKGKKVFVVDDLCDGGATFIALAKQINTDYSYLTLIVPHGIFSKGVDELLKYYKIIHTTDSYYDSRYELINDRIITHKLFYNVES